MRTDLKRVAFVCLGNICRSPLAEGVFRDVVAARGQSAQFDIDSAGIGAWHTGNPPDPRSIAVAARHGIDLSAQCARQVAPGDFKRFDYIVAMDADNLRNLKAMAPVGSTADIVQFLPFALGVSRDIEDPYYGGVDGFETAYQLIRSASEALAGKLSSGA